MKRRILTLVFVLLPAMAQGEEEFVPLPVEEIDRSEPVRFADEIYPILKRNCIACHNASKAKAKLNLESPETILKGSGEGPVVVAGKPMESLLFLASAHMEDPVMPPEKNKANAKDLTAKELGLLKRWIAEGAVGESPKEAAKEIVWQALPGNVSPVYAVDISDDNRFAACSRGNRVFVYDVATAQLYGELVDPALADKGNPAHLDLVQSLDFSRQGMLATGGFKTVKLWEREKNTILADLDPLGVAAARVAVSESGGWIAANLAGEGEIALWNAGKPLEKAKRFKDHPGALAGMVFAGEALVSVGEDGSLRFRKEGAETAMESKVAEGVRAFALVEPPHRFAAGYGDGMIRVLKFEESEGGIAVAVEREWKSGDQAVLELAHCDAGLVSFASGNEVHLWNAADGVKLRSMNHGSAMHAMAARGGVVATSGENKEVKLWSAADGKPLATAKTSREHERALAVATRVRDVSKGRLDTFKKALEAAVKARDEAQKKARESAAAAAKEIEAERKKREAADAALAAKVAAEAERDRKKAASHPRLGQAEEALKKAVAEADKLAKELADAERKLVSARRNHDLATRESVRTADAHAKADARVAEAETVLAEAEARRVESEKAVEPATLKVSALALAPDGSEVAGVAEDGSIRVWSVRGGVQMEAISGSAKTPLLAYQRRGALVSVDGKGAALVRTTQPAWKLAETLGGLDSDAFADRVNAVAFSPDGALLATGDGEPSRSGSVRLWRSRTGDAVWAKEEVHSDTVLDIAFSPDGRTLATASSDRFAKIFATGDGSLVHALEGHTGHVTRVAWRADGLVLATGSADKLVKLWNTDTGAQQRTEPAFKKEVTGLDYAGTADRLVASSGEGVIKVAKDQLQGGGEFVHAAAASADGSLVVAGGESGVFRGWTTADRKMVMEFKVAEAP